MKRRGFEGDPIEALRGADPLDRLDVPEDTQGAHARALFQEVTTMDTMEREAAVRPSVPKRRRLALAVSGAAVAALVVASIAVFAGNDSPEDVIANPPPPVATQGPVVTPDPVDAPIVGGEPIGSAAMCVEGYDLTTLAGRDIAFDGTVASFNGDNVTFDVHNWFTGGSGAQTTLNSNGLAGGSGAVTSLDGPSLEVGQRLLVSGSGGFVWACGFTMTYDTAIAGDWAAVFGG